MPEDPPCPPTEPLPDEAITNPSAFYDLDGDGVDEEVFTWRLPIGAGDDTWSLRVIDGESQINHELEDSGDPYPSEILGVRHEDDDDVLEIFVRITGGAYTIAFGVLQYYDCEIIRTTTVDGDPALWYFGASVSNQKKIVCDSPFIWTYYATISEWDADSFPLTWSVTVTRVGLTGSMWDPPGVSGGGNYESEGPEPPLVGELLECDFFAPS
mgnify:FL=1